jgi:hypothetical protein
MADIPDDGETFLDGLTITGGIGADTAGTISIKISIKNYQIDKQSGAGIYLVNASPVLYSVRIENNQATSNTGAGGGGGIYNLADGSAKESKPWLTGSVMVINNSVLGSGHGGGMYNRAISGGTCAPDIEGVIFDRNQTGGNGGGILNIAAAGSACTPHIKGNTTIRRNVATSGGGVYNSSNSRPVFNNVRIEANSAGGSGGGIVASTYTEISNTTIAGNRASGYGGGIYASSKGLELVNVTLSGNQANYAGGIYIASSSVVMSNIKIENNYAITSGGGIWVEHFSPDWGQKAALFIGNGIVKGNRAGNGGGGGIYIYHSTTANGIEQMVYLSLTNVLVAENTASTGGGICFNNSNNNNTTIITPGDAAGYGIRARLTNVTIAGNTATEGGGLWNSGDNSKGNHIAVSVYNSIIWGNGTQNIRDISGRTTYHNSLVQGLRLEDSTGANTGYTNANANFDPTTSPWNTTSPLDAAYKLDTHNAGSLVNSNNNPLADTYYNFLKGKSVLDILNAAISPSGTTLGNLAPAPDSMVVSMVNRFSSDATAAQGDLTHTVTVNGAVGPSMTVTVTDTNTTAETNSRNGEPADGNIIDVGAYEKR